MKKRILAIVLSLALCFSGLNPISVYAELTEQETDAITDENVDSDDKSDEDLGSDSGDESDEELNTDEEIDTEVGNDEDTKLTIKTFPIGIKVDGKQAFYYGKDPLTGWVSVDGITYYLDSNGQLYNGLADKDGNTYCIKDGLIVTGWQIVEDAEYYFDDDGIMVKDSIVDDIPLGADGKAIYPERAVEEGVYVFTVSSAGYAVTMPDSVKTDGVSFVLEGYTHKLSQQYDITSVEDGWYKIINVYTGKAISAKENTVVQKNYEGSDGQLWKFVEYKDGYYFITSKLGTVLDCSASDMQAGDALQMNRLNFSASQKWNIEPVLQPNVLDVPDGTYQLTGYNTDNKVVIASGYRVENYTAMRLNTAYGYEGECFEITALGDGWYSIINMYNGLALDVAGANGADGAAVQQRSWDASDSQMWRFIDAGSGTCYIQSKVGTILSRADGSAEDGTAIVMDTMDLTASQIWIVEEPVTPKTIQIQDGAEYLITTALDYNCVVEVAEGAMGNGTNIQLRKEALSAAQRFRAVAVEDGWYKLESVHTGKVIEIAEAYVDGSNVHQSEWTGADTQLWRFLNAGDGFCYIQSRTGMVLASASPTVTDGTNIQVSIPKKTTEQKFITSNTNAENYIHVTALSDYKVRITLYSPSEEDIQSVAFPTWSVENDQDDIRWIAGVEVADHIWAVELDSKDFTGEGWYALVTHVYMNTAEGAVFAGSREYALKAHLEGWIYVDGLRRYRLDDGSLLNDVSEIFNPDSKYITVDRIKGITTIYGYNSETNAYDTPIKAMWCSVGNPISLTDAGTYRMGWQMKYKEMNASDGSYRCWASYVSQIYGAVYFHGVASDTPDLNTIWANAFRNLGNPASHGCIRLAAIDARWIYYNTGRGTQIRIGDNLAAPLVPTRYEWVGGEFGPDPTYIP